MPNENEESAAPAEPVEIDPAVLPPETLRRLVEDFVTRDGTDYGEREATLERRVADAMEELRRGRAVVSYDPETGTATLIVKGRRR
jgi:uncharacterized protein YheU (UPF0270 family)